MRLRPCGYRVLVKVVPEHINLQPDEEIKDGWIVSKSTGLAKEKIEIDQELAGSAIGEVVEIGKTAFNIYGDEPWIKVGDIVFFQRYEGIRIQRRGQEYRCLQDNNIVAWDDPNMEDYR